MRVKCLDKNLEDNSEDVINNCTSTTYLAQSIIGMKIWSLINESEIDFKKSALKVNIF